MTSYGGVDTLDEPITATIVRLSKASFPSSVLADLARAQGRDLLSIYNKLVQVLYPIRKGTGREVLRYAAVCWYRECSETHRPFPGTGISGDRSSYV